jgi:hypothetical protein
MKVRISIISAFLLILFVACNNSPKVNNSMVQGVHKIQTAEVIQSSNYTYLRVSEDGKEGWIAITKQDVEIGKTYYYESNIEMTNFTSKELNRTFPSIIFASKFSSEVIGSTEKSANSTPANGKKAAIAKEGIKIEKAKGGITIAELFAAKDSYAGKTVRLKGEVVKFNAQIMGKNWIHIQDGTNSNGAFDLTITSLEEVKIGDTITFEGVIALKKDFGAGYAYDVILEEGKLIP